MFLVLLSTSRFMAYMLCFTYTK